ncbi:MAG: carbonic anhydrase [Elusimicrobia bacterium CG1_02_63_36]|nr:MAG: carbonic anhydrase [Elusimicrobia bacterium CG1_02_63_36]PIP83040.1 MAG: carbonic anhydrase [Elusimicrobia bacterium CG22_combo_CG10-13_8_21_14_all_63_91]PJA14184.1 MAG: carbonic anhydrase [Elusimicrobia bacterium CG_4_10_14_0_2_um_filter_63_34]PJB24420.1 MAG: carbonic anhydrase [Elusimicrobia bacterium CG_4_9_14_3_um_filter_62_55]
MHRLKSIDKETDIPACYASTPIGDLLRFHNLAAALREIQQAELLIGMCMDSRKSLRIPDNFAFILRAGGANLRYSEFKVSYAVAVGGVRHIALIGHTECGMVNLIARKKIVVDGLVDVGWDREAAEDHFTTFAPMVEIGNEADFIYSETKRLRVRYPRLTVAPFLYKVADNRLYLLAEPPLGD